MVVTTTATPNTAPDSETDRLLVMSNEPRS